MTFPPLTPLCEYPLHGWDYGDDRDYACQRPEDPDCGQYDWRCPACVIAAQASLATYGDHTIAWRQSAHHAEKAVLLSWLIERSLYWLGRAS